MSKINGIDLSRLNNNGNYQYHVDVRKLLDEADPRRLGVSMLYDGYVNAIIREDEALKKIVASEYTRKIKEADRARDKVYTSLATNIRTARKHYNASVVDSAEKLAMIVKSYDRVTSKPYREQTSAIYNILQEFKGKYAPDIELLRLTEMVDELERTNKVTESLIDTRADERASANHDTMKEARKVTDAAYRAIVERINALIVVEGEENYAEFVIKLNELINEYKPLLYKPKRKSESEDEEYELEAGEYDEELEDGELEEYDEDGEIDDGESETDE